jgi:CHAD domain-containing protein
MTPSRDELEETARRALAAARDPRKAAAVAAAGTAAVAARFGANRLRDGSAPEFDSDAYRLLAGEPVGAGIKRVAGARVDDAIAQLRGEAGTETAEAVHEARKDIKKIRSALRMVRDEIGDDVWQRENQHYRECARQLSGFRDAEILVQALDGLAERFGPPARERFDRLRRELDHENRAAHEEGEIERAMASAAAELETGRSRIDSLPIDGDGWGLIGPGIHRSYRRGRRRLRDVGEEASVTNLHELRKRVKDLWYQLRLIREADPEMIGPAL